jgi:hypothetical protein
MGQSDQVRRHQAGVMRHRPTRHSITFRSANPSHDPPTPPDGGSNRDAICCGAFVRFWHKADMAERLLFVRFRG